MASDFPTKEDVAFWDKYDATYGMDAAGELRRGADSPTASMLQMSAKELAFDVAQTDDEKRRIKALLEAEIRRTPMDDPRREMLMRNYIASRRSGIAALGFEPSKTVLSEDVGKIPPLVNTAGFYLGDNTYSKRDPRNSGSTPTHEGMHRGIDQLLYANYDDPKKSKKLERVNARKNYDENEIAVRALMQKYYGDIESEGTLKGDPTQINQGTVYLMENMDFLNELEQMAAEELKRRGRPMGPR